MAKIHVHVLWGVSSKDLGWRLQTWLDENPEITIEHVAQSQDGFGWVTMTIFYRR